MPSPKTLNPELVRTQLEKILSSAGFARNDRLSGFLRFVVEQELFGRADELKESVIGVEYFGRPADYKPQGPKPEPGRPPKIWGDGRGAMTSSTSGSRM